MTKFDDVFKVNCLTLNITNHCNLKCAYCFEKNKGNENMTTEDAIIIFEKGYQNFKKNYDEGTFYLAFFGGEPFLNFEVIKNVVLYAKEKDYDDVSFGATTNLTILTDSMANFIEENNIHLIVSIDGVKDVHDKNRCGSYDTVAANVKKLIDIGAVRLVEARMTLMPDDIETMFDGVANLIELGIDNIDPLFVVDTDWPADKFVKLMEETERLINLVINIANMEGNKRNISIKTVEEKIIYCYQYDNKDSVPCTFGSNSYISVAPNGDIMPCHQRHYTENSESMDLGNILTDKIKDENLLGKIVPHSWKSEVAEFECSKCQGKNLCRGWCPSENWDQRKDVSIVPKVMCYYYIMLSKIIPHYQEQVMNATNLRSHQLNMLKYSMEVLKELNEIKKLAAESSEFIGRLIDLNSKIIIEKDMILPAFVSTIYDEIEKLKIEIKELGGMEDGKGE